MSVWANFQLSSLLRKGLKVCVSGGGGVGGDELAVTSMCNLNRSCNELI